LDDRGLISGRRRDISLCHHCVQIGCGAHIMFYPLGIGGFFMGQGCKATGM